MKLLARVHITPPHTLEGDEYDQAVKLSKTWAREWNTGHRAKINELSLVVLDRQTAEYEDLRQFFLSRVQEVPPERLGWYENVEAVYSPAELRHFEILELYMNGTAGLGGNTYAQVYELSTCETCGVVTIHRQLRNLVTDLTKVTKDFANTLDFFEDLVSDRLRSLLVKAGVTGVELKPVEHARPSRRPKRAYFQLIVHNVLAPLLAPRYQWTKACPSCGRGSDAQGNSADKPDPWTEIQRWGPGPWSEMHFPRAAYGGWDLMRTAETFGRPVLPSDPRPEFHMLLISQRLHELLRQHKMSGFWVRPAHLD